MQSAMSLKGANAVDNFDGRAARVPDKMVQAVNSIPFVRLASEGKALTSTAISMTDGYSILGQCLADDDADLPNADQVQALMLTTPGTVRVTTATGVKVDLAYDEAVGIHPIKATRILQTGTTAPELVVIYKRATL